VRTALSQLEVIRPRTLDEALVALAANDDLRPIPIAGGTDLFVYLNAGTQTGRRFLDLHSLRELSTIEAQPDAIRFGARVTFHVIRSHAAVRRRLPALAAAAAEIGGIQIQHRATIGGNIANASPAGDSLPVLLAHAASVIVRSVENERTIPFDRLFTGYRKLALDPAELITAVRVPVLGSKASSFFRKVGTRRAQSISKVVFCARIEAGARGRIQEARLAYGSMAPVPVLALQAAASLASEPPSRAAARRARAALERDLAPIDDIRSDRDYRMAVAGNLLEQCLRAFDPRFAHD
jgi:CO/xanthine dehydrogenase FAD-binding subunit